MNEELVTPETALKELENKHKQQEMLSGDANARNPYNDPRRSSAKVIERLESMTDDGYKMPFQRVD